MSEEFDFDAMFGESNSNPEVQQGTHVSQDTPVSQNVQMSQDTPVQQSVPQSIPVQTSQSMANNLQASQKNTEVASVSDDFEIGFSNEMMDSLNDAGISVVDIGVKVSRVPIERYRAASAKNDRIAFITKKAIPIKYHYIQGVGSIICTGGICCEVGGTPHLRYLFPIAVYQTDNDGNISGSKVELKILSAPDDLYKQIGLIQKSTKLYGGIDHVDCLVTCTDDKYQKINLTMAGPAVWRKYSQIANFLRDRWMKDGAEAYQAVARKMDESTLVKLLHMNEEGTEDAQPRFDAANNQDLSKFFN